MRLSNVERLVIEEESELFHSAYVSHPSVVALSADLEPRVKAGQELVIVKEPSGNISLFEGNVCAVDRLPGACMGAIPLM